MSAWPAPSLPSLPGRGPVVRLFDTAQGRVVPVAAEGGTARLYVCGITPYDATHLGHAATYVAFDLLHRAWLDAGQQVRYAQNVTDVDDPLLERAAAMGVDWHGLAQEQIALFAEDMTALAVLPPQHYASVVDNVPLIVDAVERLLGAGAAYQLPDGDVYFDITADAAFGEISHLAPDPMRELFAERGGDPDRAGKRHQLDCLLWRAERPGEPTWDGGGLGKGRPGWHVECTAIALQYLGTSFDVQGGGSDLIFPHHEMSASHAQVLTGQPFAQHYAHSGMVALAGEKMSKSRGNLVFVSRLRADGVPGPAIRLALLAHHYRQDWEWTPAVLASATRRLDRWREALSREDGPDHIPTLAAIRQRLADDLDARGAIAAVDRWADEQLATGGEVAGAPGVVARALDALLGVRL